MKVIPGVKVGHAWAHMPQIQTGFTNKPLTQLKKEAMYTYLHTTTQIRTNSNWAGGHHH